MSIQSQPGVRLVVPFAILNTAAKFRAVLIAVYLVAALGIYVAVILIGPIKASHHTIDKWLIKQRSLLQGSQELHILAIDRDMIPEVEKDLTGDKRPRAQPCILAI